MVLATGRHPEYYRRSIGGQVAFDGYLSCNGQFCYTDREVIYRKFIADGDIQGLIRLLGETDIPMAFTREEGTFVRAVDGDIQRAVDLLGMAPPQILDPQTLVDPKIFALLLCGGPQHDDQVLSVMPGCRAVRWTDVFTDIIPTDGGKAAGVDAFLAHYGIPREEAMAFGDAQNDLTMLERVGLSVAMGNAADEVKAVADYVTDSVGQDGIRNALKQFEII